MARGAYPAGITISVGCVLRSECGSVNEAPADKRMYASKEAVRMNKEVRR